MSARYVVTLTDRREGFHELDAADAFASRQEGRVQIHDRETGENVWVDGDGTWTPGTHINRGEAEPPTGDLDIGRVAQHADGTWFIEAAKGDLEGRLFVLRFFHDRECASAVCTTLNTLVIADAMHAAVDQEKAEELAG